MFTQFERDHIYSCKIKIENLVEEKGIPKINFSVIAGGVFVSFLRDEDYKDIDVFVFHNMMSYTLTHNSILQNNSQYLKSQNKNITGVFLDDVKKINTIFTKYSSRKELIDDFDYSHCCVSYDFNKLYITPQTYKAIMNKKLIVNNSNSISEHRKQKFKKRGFVE